VLAQAVAAVVVVVEHHLVTQMLMGVVGKIPKMVGGTERCLSRHWTLGTLSPSAASLDQSSVSDERTRMCVP
jgi:hypothetical protein